MRNDTKKEVDGLATGVEYVYGVHVVKEARVY